MWGLAWLITGVVTVGWLAAFHRGIELGKRLERQTRVRELKP